VNGKFAGYYNITAAIKKAGRFHQEESLHCGTAMVERDNGRILRMQCSSPGVNQKFPESNTSKKPMIRGWFVERMV
jgi:hypothetical protein